MTLSEETKRKIEEEFNDFIARVGDQYGNNSLEERAALGQFYTPPSLCISMLEKFDSLENDDVLDPTSGSGNLLCAAIIAGADPKRVYANELDSNICENVLRPRLEALGVPSENIHIGDALNEDCLKLWSKEYEFKDGKVFIAGKRPMKMGSMYCGIDRSKVKVLK